MSDIGVQNTPNMALFRWEGNAIADFRRKTSTDVKDLTL
jgi:hypothetical protein